jgi:anti-sigma factor RsiW
MTHKSEDELLAYALEVTATEEERGDIAAHLRACPECRARLESIRVDIGAIAAVRPRSSSAATPAGGPSTVRTPEPRGYSSPVYMLLRAAALVAVGIVVGFGIGSRLDREPVFLSPSHIETAPPAVENGSAPSDATGLSASYYENITG